MDDNLKERLFDNLEGYIEARDILRKARSTRQEETAAAVAESYKELLADLLEEIVDERVAAKLRALGVGSST